MAVIAYHHYLSRELVALRLARLFYYLVIVRAGPSQTPDWSLVEEREAPVSPYVGVDRGYMFQFYCVLGPPSYQSAGREAKAAVPRAL